MSDFFPFDFEGEQELFDEVTTTVRKEVNYLCNRRYFNDVITFSSLEVVAASTVALASTQEWADEVVQEVPPVDEVFAGIGAVSAVSGAAILLCAIGQRINIGIKRMRN